MAAERQPARVGPVILDLSPVRSWARHWPWMLVLGFLLAVAAVPVAWFQGTAQYRATAVVHVAPRFGKNLDEDVEQTFQSNSQYRQYLTQQSRTVNRIDILEDALERLGEARWQWQEEGETLARAAARLQAELAVRPVSDTYLITVSLEGEEPAFLARLVNAVVDVYLERSRAEEFFGFDERLASLEAQLAAEREALERRLEEKAAIADALGITTFEPSMASPFDQLIVSLQDRLARARQEREVAVAELAAQTRTPPSGLSPLAGRVARLVADDAGMVSLKANLNTRRAELVSRGSGLTERHPAHAVIAAELADLDAATAALEEKLARRYREALLAELVGRVDEARAVEAAVTRQLAEERRRAASFASRFERALVVQEAIDRANARIRAISDRLDFLALEREAPGFVRLATPARAPEVPASGGRKRALALLLVLVAGAVLGLPLAVDLLDPRLRYLSRLEKGAGLRPALALPASGSEDSARQELARFAARLDREFRAGTVSAVHLCGLRDADASATRGLARALARALAELGTRAQLVTAPPRALRERLIDAGDCAAETLHLVPGAGCLASAEAEALAGIADATVLVVDLATDRCTDLFAALAWLERVDPPVVALAALETSAQEARFGARASWLHLARTRLPRRLRAAPKQAPESLES